MSSWAALLPLLTVIPSFTLAPSAAAQEGQDLVLRLRVLNVINASRVEVDRGERDLVRRGDLVLFSPREGGSELRGTVVQVAARSAVVELIDRTVQAPPSGTSGAVRIPASRRTPEAPPPAGRDPAVPPPPEGRQPDPGQPGQRWQRGDDGWREGMPLLAQVRPVRPQERPSVTRGRAWFAGDVVHAPEDGFGSSYARLGFDSVTENPLGHGGELQLDAELDSRTEQNEQRGVDLLVRRFSYTIGGERFRANRFEIGRFVLTDTPELGVLDGVQWSRRSPEGHRYGASIGFLPEPDDDFDTLRDLSFTAHYLWASDASERVVVGGAVQQTFHDGHRDRDLFLLKGRVTPGEGWNLHGTVWIDYYESNDPAKGNGLEVTRVQASANRRWKDGSGLDISYLRQRFPELLRSEFRPLAPNEINDARWDRLQLRGWAWASEDTRVFGHGSVWSDERDEGSSLELGGESQEWWSDDDTLGLTVFGTLGRFTTVLGARVDYGRTFADGMGRWDVLYEIANHHLDGFAADRDDLLQHRIRAAWALRTETGWSFGLHAATTLWDEDFAWSLGTTVERRF